MKWQRRQPKRFRIPAHLYPWQRRLASQGVDRMKLAGILSWFGRPSRRTNPSTPRLALMKLEERAVPAIFGAGAGNASVEGIVRLYDDNGVLKATIKPFP